MARKRQNGRICPSGPPCYSFPDLGMNNSRAVELESSGATGRAWMKDEGPPAGGLDAPRRSRWGRRTPYGIRRDTHRDGWESPSSERSEATYAALDLGTNNCRLLIARPAAGGFRVVDAFSRIVRLGEGLEATGALGEAAMARTLDALRVCAGKLAQRRVVAIRSVATEACRRAVNCGAFLERVRNETGIE